MNFIVVRLGKDSVSDINKLDNSPPETFSPYLLEFSCKQVEGTIEAGCFVLLYIGSDNNKGITTQWKQGLRAVGKLKQIEGRENFQSTCKLSIEILSVFHESLDQFSFLEQSPNLYKHFSKYPIVGVKSSRNNSVQKVNDAPRENTSALLTAISLISPNFKKDAEERFPELLPMLGFIPDTDFSKVKSEGLNKTSSKNRNFDSINAVHFPFNETVLN